MDGAARRRIQRGHPYRPLHAATVPLPHSLLPLIDNRTDRMTIDPDRMTIIAIGPRPSDSPRSLCSGAALSPSERLDQCAAQSLMQSRPMVCASDSACHKHIVMTVRLSASHPEWRLMKSREADDRSAAPPTSCHAALHRRRPARSEAGGHALLPPERTEPLTPSAIAHSPATLV